MTDDHAGRGAVVTSTAVAEPVPTQAVTVVAPTPAPLLLNVGTIAGWGGAMLTIAGVVALVWKWIAREISRDLADVRRDVDDLKHKVAGERTRITALEHARASDNERFARLETSSLAIERWLERIEKNQGERFDQLAESIREIRVVAPR